MKIELGRPTASGSSFGNLSVSGAENERKAIATQLEQHEAAPAAPPSQPAAITTLTASNINQAVSRADEAIAAITEIRAEQRDLAELAAAAPEVSSTHETFSTRIAELEDEVARVTSAASYQGTSVLTGGTYELIDQARTVNQVVSVADASALIAPRTDSFSTAAEADAVYDELGATVSSLRSFQAGTSAARTKAEQIPEAADKPPIDTTPSSSAASSLSEPEARKLVREVAQKISSAYGDPQASRELIEAATSGLDAERVKDLLE